MLGGGQAFPEGGPEIQEGREGGSGDLSSSESVLQFRGMDL